MKKTTQIKMAGTITGLFFVFHLFFYWLFDWKNTLAYLNNEHHALMLCYNIIFIGVFAMMTFISLFRTVELYKTGIGIVFLIFSSMLYWFRIIAEFTFFGIKDALVSVIIIALCAIPAILYATPLLSIRKKD